MSSPCCRTALALLGHLQLESPGHKPWVRIEVDVSALQLFTSVSIVYLQRLLAWVMLSTLSRLGLAGTSRRLSLRLMRLCRVTWTFVWGGCHKKVSTELRGNFRIIHFCEAQGKGRARGGPGRSLKGHLWMVDGGWGISFP